MPSSSTKQTVVSSRARSKSPQSRRDHHPRSKSAQSRGSERTDWSRPRSISTEGRRPRSTSRGTRNSGDINGRAISRTRKIYDTPYDTKGRCHYHPQVQLAKKKLTGGYKVVIEKCPKCMEELYIINADKRGRLSTRTKTTIPTSRNNDDGDDNRSTRSGTKSSSGKRAVDTKNKEQKDLFADDKSVFSRLSIKSSTSKGIVGNGRKQQQHNEVSDDRSVFSRLSSVASVSRSVANKHNNGNSSVFSRRNSNSPGRGGSSSDRKKYYDNSDDRSVSSRNSRKSSGGGGGGGGSNGTKKTTTMHSTKRYEYPFDAQGYCHMHPHIKLATKKLTGGWKINCDFCPECGDEDDDDNRSMGSRNSRKSTSSRRSTKSSSSKKGSSRSSKSSSAAGVKKSRSTKNNDDSDTVSELSSIQFKRNSPNSKNDQSMKNSKIEKNMEVSPKVTTSLKKGTSHGSSSSKVEWDKELPKINSSLKKGTSIGSSSIDKKQYPTPVLPSDSQRQNALLAYKQLYNSAARVVKNMIFEDIHGKLGRYTGEVNELKLPHGMGDIVYDNGLTQGGNWTNGVLD